MDLLKGVIDVVRFVSRELLQHRECWKSRQIYTSAPGKQTGVVFCFVCGTTMAAARPLYSTVCNVFFLLRALAQW